MAGGGVRKRAEAEVIACLAAGAKVADAAKAATVSERTVYRWRAEADFERRVSEARAELVDQALGLLSKASAAAALTLASLLGKDHPDSTRIRAAVAILDLRTKLHQDEDLEKRVALLEASLTTEKGR